MVFFLIKPMLSKCSSIYIGHQIITLFAQHDFPKRKDCFLKNIANEYERNLKGLTEVGGGNATSYACGERMLYEK